MFLLWHLTGSVSLGKEQGPIYRLDQSYSVVDVWLRCKAAPQLNPVEVDIKVDGVSLFSLRPRITVKQLEGTGILRSDLTGLRAESLVTLDVESVDNPIGDLTVLLYLEEE